MCLCEEQGIDQNAQHAGVGLKNVSIHIPPHTPKSNPETFPICLALYTESLFGVGPTLGD